MLYLGRHNSLYLYELTTTDLMWEDTPHNSYFIGNVLFYGNKKDVSLGLELAKADDLTTAHLYLESGLSKASLTERITRESYAALSIDLADAKAELSSRDTLLDELTTDLEAQRLNNQLLLTQLENMHEQVSIEKITRNEVLGDLQMASAETFRIDRELQKAMDAKDTLEQELAARICELIEMNNFNAELQKRLEEHHRSAALRESKTSEEAAGGATAAAETADVDLPEADAPSNVASSNASADALAGALAKAQTKVSEHDRSPAIAQVYTMPDGKELQIYHDFPLSQGRVKKRGVAVFKGVLRGAVLVIVAIVMQIAGSAIATAFLNNVSIGEGLDITFKSFFPFA